MAESPVMKTPALVAFVVFTTLVSVGAQVTPPFQPTGAPAEPSSEPTKVKGFWLARLAGGEFVVSLDRISSVSRHSYVLDGTVLVDEVTIDTTGQALARFYFLSPLGVNSSGGGSAASVLEKSKGLLDAAGQRTGVDLENMVIKKYPDTTHAKAIEYRIGTQAELVNLYNSAKQAWQSGQGGLYTAPPK